MVGICTLGRCRVGAWAWTLGSDKHITVVAKASFSLPAEGEPQRLAAQPLRSREHHHQTGILSSVALPTDRVPFRTRADVVLVGHAYPDAGQPAAMTRQGALRLSRGEERLVDKTLLVRGDQQAGEQLPLEKIPLRYEQPYGGSGCLDNPLGVGANGLREPNIVYPNEPTVPAGFGPISQRLPSRKRLLSREQLSALAVDANKFSPGFVWDYFQCAPSDQQIPFLRGDEVLYLLGVHPQVDEREWVLPQLSALGAIYGLNGDAATEVILACDTVLIEPDEQRVSLSWRGWLRVPSDAETSALVVVAGVASDDEPLALPSHMSLVDEAEAAGAPGFERDNRSKNLGATMPVAGESQSSPTAAPYVVAKAGDSRPSSAGPPSLPWEEGPHHSVPAPKDTFEDTLDMLEDTVEAAFARARSAIQEQENTLQESALDESDSVAEQDLQDTTLDSDVFDEGGEEHPDLFTLAEEPSVDEDSGGRVDEPDRSTSPQVDRDVPSGRSTAGKKLAVSTLYQGFCDADGTA